MAEATAQQEFDAALDRFAKEAVREITIKVLNERFELDPLDDVSATPPYDLEELFKNGLVGDVNGRSVYEALADRGDELSFNRAFEVMAFPSFKGQLKASGLYSPPAIKAIEQRYLEETLSVVPDDLRAQVSDAFAAAGKEATSPKHSGPSSVASPKHFGSRSAGSPEIPL